MPLMTNIFKAVSDENRLRIVRMVLAVDSSVCVCELVDALEMLQYQVSRHLAVLKNAGLMHVTKKGTWSYYGLDESDPLLSAFWTFLRTAPMGSKEQEQLRRDRKAMEHRLQLRANGVCVVGLRSNQSNKAERRDKGVTGKNEITSM